MKITLTFPPRERGHRDIIARVDDGPRRAVGTCSRHTFGGTQRHKWTACLFDTTTRITRDTAAEMEAAVREHLRVNGRWWT